MIVRIGACYATGACGTVHVHAEAAVPVPPLIIILRPAYDISPGDGENLVPRDGFAVALFTGPGQRRSISRRRGDACFRGLGAEQAGRMGPPGDALVAESAERRQLGRHRRRMQIFRSYVSGARISYAFRDQPGGSGRQPSRMAPARSDHKSSRLYPALRFRDADGEAAHCGLPAHVAVDDTDRLHDARRSPREYLVLRNLPTVFGVVNGRIGRLALVA